MDSEDNVIASRSQKVKATEFDGFGEESRFKSRESLRMIDAVWERTELIPLLRRAYEKSLPEDHNYEEEICKAEFIEPHHQPNYPIDDPVFVERLRLALVAPNLVTRPSLVVNIAADRMLVIRLLLRRYNQYGGAFALASLPPKIQPGMEADVTDANAADEIKTAMFMTDEELRTLKSKSA